MLHDCVEERRHNQKHKKENEQRGRKREFLHPKSSKTINTAHRQDIFGLNEKVLVLHQTTLLDAILFKNTFHPSQLKTKHITIQSINWSTYNYCIVDQRVIYWRYTTEKIEFTDCQCIQALRSQWRPILIRFIIQMCTLLLVTTPVVLISSRRVCFRHCFLILLLILLDDWLVFAVFERGCVLWCIFVYLCLQRD